MNLDIVGFDKNDVAAMVVIIPDAMPTLHMRIYQIPNNGDIVTRSNAKFGVSRGASYYKNHRSTVITIDNNPNQTLDIIVTHLGEQNKSPYQNTQENSQGAMG